MNQKHNFRVGPTNELSLRVSVAALVKVVFQNPSDGEWMLALERKATLYETEQGREIQVRSQPFGGAIHIRDLNLLHDLIGDFHFDSEYSRAEQDFRIFIRPLTWAALRDYCLQHISREDDPLLETHPERELAEEFAGALKIDLKFEQYICKSVGTLVENQAVPTDNFYSKGSPTVRLYRIFEASITDSHLMDIMLKNTEGSSDQELRELAWKDFHNGGNGWANAVLVVPLKSLTDHYLAMPLTERNKPFFYQKNLLDDSVSAILEGAARSKYQKRS